MPGVRLGVVGRVVGHRESVAGGVELEGVVDSGVSERAFQQLGLAGGERVVVLRAGHVDRGGDAVRQKVRARRVAGDSQPAAVERRGRGDLATEPARGDQRHAPAQAVSGGADRGSRHFRSRQQEARVGGGIGDDPVIGEHAGEAGQPCPLLLVREQRGHVERCPRACAVVDIWDQRDITHARQPVAHLPERLPRSARVRKNQHARPRAIPVGKVQRPVAAAIGCRNLNVQAAHSAPSAGFSSRLVEADRPNVSP